MLFCRQLATLPLYPNRTGVQKDSVMLNMLLRFDHRRPVFFDDTKMLLVFSFLNN